MAEKLEWHKDGSRVYETGIDHVILFPDGSQGIAWDGVSSLSENPTGAEPNDVYADNIKYLTLTSVEEFEASIEAYSRPVGFLPCDGFALPAGVPAGAMLIGQQPRKKFGLYYRTRVLNELSNVPMYKHHFVWNATAGVSDRSYETVNDSPEPISFSWDITTIPVTETVTLSDGSTQKITTASLVINEMDQTDAEDRASLRAAIETLVETVGNDMPTLQEIYNAIKNYA